MTNAKNRGAPQQPLEAVEVDAALLRQATVAALIGATPSTLARLQRPAADPLPPPATRLGRSPRWRAADVRGWLARQVGAEERTGAAP